MYSFSIKRKKKKTLLNTRQHRYGRRFKKKIHKMPWASSIRQEQQKKLSNAHYYKCVHVKQKKSKGHEQNY